MENNFPHPVDSISMPSESNTPHDSIGQPNAPTESLNSNMDGDTNEDSNKLGAKSDIWKHYERFKDSKGECKAKCIHCNSVLGAKTRNGTTTLRNHIEFYCKRLKIINSKQATIAATFTKHTQNVDGSSFSQESSRQDLAKMIIMHEYPLSCVDHIGMRRLLTGLQPTFKIPTRNTIKKDIIGLYESEKFNAMRTLDGNDGQVAITTDMWTSNQRKGYMVVTAHYLNNSWRLQNRILSFCYVPTPHTSEVLSDTLMKVLLEWNVDRKLSTITIDNCSTNDAMMDNLLGRLDSTYLLLGGKLLHMRCCAHILNLIVKDGLEVVKDSIEKIRSSVLYWNATPKRSETFVAWCAKTSVPHTKKLVVDCPTRWNSTFLMLETALIYKEVFPRLRQKDPQYKSLPSNDEWELAKEICDKLKVFYVVTQLFSGTQYPTSNMFFDKICEIKLALTAWVACDNPIIRDMAISMSLKFNKYWDTIHGILGIAAVLDPRLKMSSLEFYFGEIYSDEFSKEREIEKIQQYFCDLISEYQQSKGSSSSSTTVDLSYNDDLTGCGINPNLAKYIKTKKRSRVSARTELDNYLDGDLLPAAPNFDLLLWWKVNGAQYPTLQQIARDVLAIPVTTVASESAFSTSGRLISTHRSRLTEQTIEALMCSQNWLWALEKDSGPLTLDEYVTIDNDVDVDDDNEEVA